MLHRVGGREIVTFVVDAAMASGCEPVAVVVPPDHTAFSKVPGGGVLYAIQDQQLGSGHALLEGCDHVTVFNGDWTLVDPSTASELIRRHVSSGAAVTLLTSELTSPKGMGRIVWDSQGHVQGIVEQFEAGEDVAAINEVNAGLYCFDGSWIWEAAAQLQPSEVKDEMYLTDLVSKAAAGGGEVSTVRSGRSYANFGVNTRQELEETETALTQPTSNCRNLRLTGHYERGNHSFSNSPWTRVGDGSGHLATGSLLRRRAPGNAQPRRQAP